MKLYSPALLARTALVGMAFSLLGACAKPQPLQPSQLYQDVGTGRVGGPMRLAKEKNTPRNPPLLPHIHKVDPEALAGTSSSAAGQQPPPPPPDTTYVSATPQVASQGPGGSPVPSEADAYFQQQQQPQQTSALGALFQSIFQPPPTPPPTTSSATYQVVP